MIFDDPLLRLQDIGRLKTVNSHEIEASSLSIGFECLDRFIFDPVKCYDKLAAVGIKHARCQTGWCRCEREKGRYDFAWLDEVVDNLLARGIKPWFNVGFGNKLYMPDAFGEAAVGWVPLYYGAEVIEAWENYLFSLAEHFRNRVTHYEIWNETNLDCFWQPGKANPGDYLRLIELSRKRLLAADPGIKIGACVTGTIHQYLIDLVKLGVGCHIDFLSVHPYRIVPEKGYFGEIKSLRRLLDGNGGRQVKIWQGEVGFGSYFPQGHFLNTWSRGSEHGQAKWLLRRYLIDLACGLEMTSFFQMVDMNGKKYETSRGTQNPCLHGILHGISYEPKKAYYAVQHFAALFDADTVSADLFVKVDFRRALPLSQRLSRLPEVATLAFGFVRQGWPLYVYYLPEDVQMDSPGLVDVDLAVADELDRKLENPVLIDLLSGRVFKIEEMNASEFWHRILFHLPLTDYPLVVTDLAAVRDRVDMKQ